MFLRILVSVGIIREKSKLSFYYATVVQIDFVLVKNQPSVTFLQEFAPKGNLVENSRIFGT
jgi:hypothetical protein